MKRFISNLFVSVALLTAISTLPANASPFDYFNGEFDSSLDSVTIADLIEYNSICAQEGDPEAQFVIGSFYAMGVGFPQDYSKAFDWYCKSAEQDYAPAQNDLGICYLFGYGVDCDFNEAFRLFRSAAINGLDLGQFNMAYCYYHGFGVEKDFSQSLEWLKIAAVNDNPEAQTFLGLSYLTGDGVETDYEKAGIYLLRAAMNGFAKASAVLACCYASGLGVKQDMDLALYWADVAAEQSGIDVDELFSLIDENTFNTFDYFAPFGNNSDSKGLPSLNPVPDNDTPDISNTIDAFKYNIYEF